MNWIKAIMAKLVQSVGQSGLLRYLAGNRRLKYGVPVLLAFGALGIWLYRTGSIGPAKVVAAKAEIGTLKPTVFGIGTVQAKMTYNVGPVQTGKILKLYVDQGDSVKAGQVIGEIDPVDMDQRIASYYAALVSSQHDTAVAQAQIEQAKSQNQLAQAEIERYTQLFEQGAISKESLDTQENNAKVAQAVVDSALSNYQSTQSKMVKAEADYQGQIEQKKNLLLISPVDGVVTARNMEEGSTAVAGQAVYNIIDLRTLWVQTRIDQTQFNGIALGQTAEIVLRSNQSQRLAGKIVRLESQGDTVTEERLVDVKITNTPNNVFLGDLADVTISLPDAVNALYVPANAVKSENGRDGVWVIRDGRAYYRTVKTGVKTMDGNVQILNGLEQGDTVIVYSRSKITDGTRVRMVSEL
ncbi:rnd efflux pump membrane fusion protein barrel-sandwich domain [Lucifera butyrica]|uniref:Rnd efflux pump membrane fusion protein barrel-sandwich domain n=1 Tax=Lucifera butyrica TaxID=1351585 RepID=A0A498RAL5_9FIRM|nr:efflux RND transporter periplasmic adaptor subunit [Lucifera butyrica]VBB08524.1 rnd efflux pump membrane fusion protein barrel-sandwich domain [Lucifera butyrica]